MATLTLNPSITCMGCAGLKQYPKGFRSGLCFMCFPRSIDNRDCKITLSSVTRPAICPCPSERVADSSEHALPIKAIKAKKTYAIMLFFKRGNGIFLIIG